MPAFSGEGPLVLVVEMESHGRTGNRDENELQRIVIDALAGKRVLPPNPKARDIAQRIWAEIDTLTKAGSIVDIPPSLP